MDVFRSNRLRMQAGIAGRVWSKASKMMITDELRFEFRAPRYFALSSGPFSLRGRSAQICGPVVAAGLKIALSNAATRS